MEPNKHPLAVARRSANLSQRELGELISRDRVTIARLERAGYKPSFETVAKIITALAERGVKLSADVFIDGASK